MIIGVIGGGLEISRPAIFIANAWTYGEDYDRLVDLLHSHYGRGDWINLSSPENQPIPVDPEQTTIETANVMARATAVLVPADAWSDYETPIRFELNLARHQHKPILCVIPWGSKKPPAELLEICHAVVGWNGDEIGGAIAKLI